MEQRRRDADAIAVDDAKKIAQQAYQQDMNRLARDAATQTLIEAQDSIELGQPLVGTRNFQSGFMNRLAQVLGARDAILGLTIFIALMTASGASLVSDKHSTRSIYIV